MTFISGVTEDELQKQVASWLHYALPPGCVFHHSPNEGTRHVAFKMKLKLMGTKFGWPDLEIFVPADESKVGISTSVFIELKRLKGGSSHQTRKKCGTGYCWPGAIGAWLGLWNRYAIS